MGHSAFAFVVLAAAVPLAAQTFTVGPGGNYPSIGAAIASVPDGATLVVSAGTYPSFSLVNKGLTIIGTGTVVIDGNLNSPQFGFVNGTLVQTASPSQTVTLVGLSFPQTTPLFPTATPNPNPLTVRGVGAVVLTNCSVAPTSTTAGYDRFELDVSASQVMIRGCTCGSTSVAGDVVIENSSFRGRNQVYGFGTYPALLTSGDVDVRGGSATGVFSSRWGGGYGILSSGNTRVLGGAVIDGGGFGTAIFGSAVVDPSVTLSGSAFNIVVTPLPDTTTSSAALGGTIQATASVRAGDLGILVLGFRGAPIAAPGIQGKIWIDPSAPYVFAAFGAGLLQASAAVPNNPALRGSMLAWQGISCSLTGQCTAANASYSVVF